jgi:hypothetical protein
MKRSTFLLISSIFLFLLSAVMLFAAQQMLKQVGAKTSDWAVIAMHNVAIFMFAFAVMNFLLRNVPFSAGIGSLMVGNLIALIGTISYDLRLHMEGELNNQVWPSVIIRSLFAIGFIYYLVRRK